MAVRNPLARNPLVRGDHSGGHDEEASPHNRCHFLGTALAQTCESKAVDKNGKALTGAAKSSFLTKCKRDTCAVKAVDKNGKALSGAAKNSFMQKCEREA
jgi:hypothetical protein